MSKICQILWSWGFVVLSMGAVFVATIALNAVSAHEGHGHTNAPPFPRYMDYYNTQRRTIINLNETTDPRPVYKQREYKPLKSVKPEQQKVEE